MANDLHPVDLERALLPQVGAMGEAYDAWVHRSIRPRGRLRIFESGLLEASSLTAWWVVPLVWVPVAAGFAVYALGVRQVPPLRLAALVGLGLLVWTLTEYLLHRFVFHFRPRSRFGRQLHFLAHGIHHKDPWDPLRLVFPPLPAALLAVPIFLLCHAAVAWTAEPWGNATALMTGIFAGYVVYDLTHYYTHHARPRTRLGRYLKRHHLAHHHQASDRLYGVSSPLWDVVFRTGRASVVEGRAAPAPASLPAGNSLS